MIVENLKSIDKSERVSGIYALYNKKNSKIYVGSSLNMYKRVIGHIRELNKNNHYNEYLQRAYIKDKEHFSFHVLERTSSQDLIPKEQYWMDYFISHENLYGYNLAPVAGNMMGFKHSNETKLKIGQKAKNRLRTQSAIAKTREAKMIPIVQLTKDYVLVQEWESATTASKSLNISLATIRSCCKGNKKSAGKFFWMDRSDYEDFLKGKVNISYKGREYKEVVQLDVNGDFIRLWDSVLSIKEELDVISGVYSCCRGAQKTAYGYQWKYKEDYERAYE